MPVEHLKHAGPFHTTYLPVVECPSIVRAVDGCYATCLDYRVHISLQRRHLVPSVDRLDDLRNPHAVDVYRRFASMYSDADLLARHHQRLSEAASAGAVLQQSQVVVVAQHQKVVTVPPVPARDLVRVFVTVRFSCMRVYSPCTTVFRSSMPPFYETFTPYKPSFLPDIQKRPMIRPDRPSLPRCSSSLSVSLSRINVIVSDQHKCHLHALR